MAQSSLRIVTEFHDEPHIAGRRVTVQRIQGLVGGADKSAEAVAAQLDLTLAEVYAALEYYHSNPEAMAAAEKQRAERETMARERSATSLAELAHDE